MTTPPSTSSKPTVWLFSSRLDIGILFVPVWVVWAICFALPVVVLDTKLPLWAWVVIVLGIDVSHVWSTLWRTYLAADERRRYWRVLLYAPLLVFVGLFAVAWVSTAWFWRVMAYIALHHFIKQQYGFFALYRARYARSTLPRYLPDVWVLYLGMLYPVVYWHLAPERNFNWFVSADFLALYQWLALPAQFWAVANGLYWLLLLGWVCQEVWLAQTHRLAFPVGKVLWVLTTAANWYLGIVYFNSDIAFTLTNVVAHGIPYMMLVYWYNERKYRARQTLLSSIAPQLAPLLRLLGLVVGVLCLALSEEYLWDWWLNRQKYQFFAAWWAYPSAMWHHPYWRAFGLALLSVPQVSHYIIDGYIWRSHIPNPHLRGMFRD